jgi:hypothetical protein
LACCWAVGAADSWARSPTEGVKITPQPIATDRNLMLTKVMAFKTPANLILRVPTTLGKIPYGVISPLGRGNTPNVTRAVSPAGGKTPVK